MGGQPALGVGLDEAWDRATPDQVKAYGASFVCRYLGEDRSGKNLSRAEAEQLSAAGLWIVSNYEYSPGGALRGYGEGQRVARLADAQHRACGGPADRPIYFSVDIDITNASQMAAVLQYFRGIASAIGIGRTGAYGEYDVIRTLFDNGLIRWGWQTYAWSRGQWDARAQIRQVANGISVSGHDVDRDENYAADYGQWMIGGNDMPMMDDAYFAALAWRADALAAGLETVRDGPQKGEPMMIVKMVNQLAAKVDQAAGGTVTQEMHDAAVLKAFQDPTVINALGAAVASHIHVS